MRECNHLPVAVIRQMVGEYHPAEGIVTNLQGFRVGGNTCDRHGRPYRRITFVYEGKRRYFYEHRIAYVLMTGAWPKKMLDHRDGNGRNNKWNNLRDSDDARNQWNMRLPKNNTSGVIGVSWDRAAGKWRAMIRVHGKVIHLGRFVEFDDACAARREAEDKYHEGIRFVGE